MTFITLLTDFGAADYFVGAVKGAILSVNPSAAIVDITHEVPPQNIESAAFTLLAAYQTLPAGTIHVAVVDPGVGSARRPIIVRAGEHFFVGGSHGYRGLTSGGIAAAVRVLDLKRLNCVLVRPVPKRWSPFICMIEKP